MAGHEPHCSEREDAGGSRAKPQLCRVHCLVLGCRRAPSAASVPSGFTHLSTPQKTSSPVRTAAFGIAASGTCKPTSCTIVPVARAPAPPPQPPSTRSPRSRTPTSESVPFPSAAKAAPAPAPWRSTCVATAVRPHAPQAPHLLSDSMCEPMPQIHLCGIPTTPHSLPQIP